MTRHRRAGRRRRRNPPDQAAKVRTSAKSLQRQERQAQRAMDRNKARIEAGVTFRSRKRSTWRVGAGPGSYDSQ